MCLDEAGFLDDAANPLGDLGQLPRHSHIQNPDLAGLRFRETEKCSEGGGFAGSVGTEEPGDAAGRYLETEPAQCLSSLVGLEETVNCDGG